MTLLTLILRNLRYYLKSYFSILVGTVISTAVLTGALVVGDSVKYSLENLTDIRLGKTRFAIQAGNHFFRQDLASELKKQTGNLVAPVLQLEGIAINTDKDSKINRVDVLGVDERFFKLWNIPATKLNADEAILSRNTAEKLNLKTGDEFLLKIRKQSKASENAPFVSEKEPLVAFRLKVTAIADNANSGRFSLKINQSAPFNIFVSLPILAQKTGLGGNVNLLLIAGNESENLISRNIDSLLRLSWQPEDAGLEIRKLPTNNTNEIRSGRIFIDDNSAKAIRKSIPGAQPVFTYLVNGISTHGRSTPYSFVSAVDERYLLQTLSEGEILISSWLAADLEAIPGDSLTIRYFKMGAMRKLTEDSARFCIKSILPRADPLFDRTLMPDFPGMSDAGNCRDWETGAPVNLDKIRDKDEQYWNDYRGTPKAFISLAAGQKLWDNAFGHATAFRFKADSSGVEAMQSDLMQHLNPAENGMSVRDVYTEGKTAAANSTDFGQLFLSLSFFIIVASLILISLLFSLHAHKRMAETGILSTLGFRKRDIILILFFEVFFVVIAGSSLGSVCGIFYNKLLLLGLNTLWQDAVQTSILQMHIEPATIWVGFATGSITALISLSLVLIRNLLKPISSSVKGVKIPLPGKNQRRKKFSLGLSVVSVSLAVMLIGFTFISSQDDPSEVFLSAGGLMLVAGIAFLNFTLLSRSLRKSESLPAFFTMVLLNIGMSRGRSLTAVALLAIGTFSVIITGANRKTFYGTENTRNSGTGGFLFWAESTVPLLEDLNSPEGKAKYGLADEDVFRKVRFSQMLRLDGNDASCLNLNQVSQVQILGVNTTYFDQQQAFGFLKLDHSIDIKHPWPALNVPLAPAIIPAYADQTVIQWGLRKNIGDTLLYRDEKGETLKVILMGGLDNSVFQGNILISAELFRHYFPSVAGSKLMLIDGAFAERGAVSERMEYLFQDYGMLVTPASERLAQFNAVENTYLSVFMLLGGLGIVIGTLGMGIVLLRNLTERKQEIALYQALGFRHHFILKLIFAENFFILLAGIGIGTIAAFTGILPSFFSPAFRMPTVFLLALILVILLNGIVWIYFPIKSALRKNLIQALRKE
jgi:ABC-type antimicrobial peptide transport system permease subunit